MKKIALLALGALAACAHHDATSDPNVADGTIVHATYDPTGRANTQPESAGQITPEATAPGSTAAPQATAPTTIGTPESVRPTEKPSENAAPSTATSPTPAPALPPTAAEPVTSGNGPATVMDQGNSTSDVKITAAIRRAVISDGSLSLKAKNVKIITNGGHVALRGVVKSEAERTKIEEKARAVDGVTDVDNRLEVKP